MTSPLDGTRRLFVVGLGGRVRIVQNELAFGKDGKLYLSTGDGGGNGDPGNNAQDRSDLSGKILRFRVVRARESCGRNYCVPASNPFAGGTPGHGLIWALGLRNPWRFSVDPATGNLWIGGAPRSALHVRPRRRHVDRRRLRLPRPAVSQPAPGPVHRR